VRNDAVQNLVTAIQIANPAFSRLPVVPEVMIYFGGKLLRGNRAIKDDTSGYTAYRSPNIASLGEAGDRIVIDEGLIRPRPGSERRFHIRTKLESRVMPLFIYPGISLDHVQKQLSLPGLKAVIVHAFGSGNIPTHAELLQAFREARRNRNIVLAIVSQCRRGPVELGIYETSAELLEAGFISGGDLGVEAAQCKLMTLLGEPDITPEEVECEYQRSLAGEQSISQHTTLLADAPWEIVCEEEAARHRLPGRTLKGGWDPMSIDRALLRLRGGQVSVRDRDSAELLVFVNVDQEQNLDENHPNYVGKYKKYNMDKSGLVVFDVTKTVKATASPGARISFTITTKTADASLSARRSELTILVRETSSSGG
ncbi:MAG: asparaginase, partial [Myxococcales bacterium]|nr:asparaginase [Myxococcales bacterium]